MHNFDFQYARFYHFLARGAFIERMSRYCYDVRPSVYLSGTDVHCDHTVHFTADLNLRLDSPVFWTPSHQSMSTCSQPSFSSSTRNRGGYGCAN